MSAEKEDNIATLFDANGRAISGFSGIGEIRGRQDYTESEKTVLGHFFTRFDSNVYAATDNMPGQLWALLMGQYARSDMTARDRFLKLLNDLQIKNPDAASVDEIAEAIRFSGDITKKLDKAIKYAGRWIEEWGVDYGHASLRDSGVVRMCFEGVSQRVTKKLEKAREGAYQEQSTRAIPFTIRNLGMPFEVRGTPFEQAFLALGQGHIELYEQVMKELPGYLDSKHANLRAEADAEVRRALASLDEKLPDKVWEGILREKSFDVARYLIPQNMTTSLGITMNARRFQDELTEWQSSDLEELRALGRAAQAEAMLLNPNLMKYGQRSDFIADLPRRRKELFDSLKSGQLDLNVENRPYGEVQIGSTLISATPEIENLMLASILFAGSNGRDSFGSILSQVRDLSPEGKREIAESQFKGKQAHELIPKVMEVGALVFERVYDIGAFRDMQRQRGDRQQVGPYGMVGYSVPQEIKEIGLEGRFVDRMNAGKKLHDDLIAAGLPAVAEYTPAMANIIRHVVTKDPVQEFYEAKLRAQAAGIDSYRTIAHQEIEAALELMPAFKGLVDYDPAKYALNRLPEKTRGYIRGRQKKAGQKS